MLKTEFSFSQKVEIIKEKIQGMIEMQPKKDHLSSMWSYLIHFLNYVHNLSPNDLKLIRFHTRLFAGEDMINYIQPRDANDKTYQKDTLAKSTLIENYQYYTEDIPKELLINEPELAPEIGLKFKTFGDTGKCLNIDILRYQMIISNLYRMKIVEFFPSHPTILEIGTGYGGFAYHLSQCLNHVGKRASYILLDLPEILFFAAVFLALNEPQKKIYLYDKKTFTKEFLTEQIHEYDYILLPNFVLEKLLEDIVSIDFMANFCSFGEMLPKEVEGYLEFAKKKLNGFLLSDNVDFLYQEGFYEDDPQKVGRLTKLFEKTYQFFPSPQFYNEFIIESRYHSNYQKFYFLFPKQKEYPASEFWMKLRSSTNRLSGSRFSIFFSMKGKTIQTNIQKTRKPRLENFKHVLYKTVLYLTSTNRFVSKIMHAIFTEEFLNMHGVAKIPRKK